MRSAGRGPNRERGDPVVLVRRAVVTGVVVAAVVGVPVAGATRPAADAASPLRTVHVGGVPDRVVVGADHVWVGDGGRVSRVDPTTERIDAVSGAATPIAVGDGAFWARAHDRANAILRIDPATTRAVATIDLGVYPGAIAVAGRDVWVADPAGTVVRIDAASNTVRTRIWVGALTFGIAAGADAVWVTGRSHDDREADLWRIDPTTSSVVATIATRVNCQTLAEDAGVTWAGCITARRIDPSRNTLTSTRVGALNGLAVADRAAWALDPARRLARINDADRAVRAVTAPPGSEGIAVGYGAVWVANPDVFGTVTRDGRGSLTRIPTSRFGVTPPCPRCDQNAARSRPDPTA